MTKNLYSAKTFGEMVLKKEPRRDQKRGLEL